LDENTLLILNVLFVTGLIYKKLALFDGE